MKFILLLVFLFTVELGTHDIPILVQQDSRCQNEPGHVYQLGNNLLCLESDLIFKGGFDND